MATHLAFGDSPHMRDSTFIQTSEVFQESCLMAATKCTHPILRWPEAPASENPHWQEGQLSMWLGVASEVTLTYLGEALSGKGSSNLTRNLQTFVHSRNSKHAYSAKENP